MNKQILDGTTGTLRTLVDGTVRLQINIEPNNSQKAMEYFGKPGTGIALAVLTDETNQAILQKETTDSWQRDLYQSSFFRKPEVWKAIGTDKEFLIWTRLQPCVICKSEPAEAAHVRRIANGAGMGIKPPYSAIPLCHEHHRLQHEKGESEIGGKEQADKWRIQYVQRWAWESLKKQLGFKSWSDMHRADFDTWRLRNDL